ncbi:MAG TPA: hypothetical protein DCY94_01790 [Firmicutes bacterium]|nr:hypothetical protein [Bacillota bacterium]
MVNGLSILRICGAFVVPFIFISSSVPFLITFLIFLFATDFLDGFLARLWKVQTLGGSLLDPIGDKLLALMCICSLLPVHKKLLVLLAIEFLIALINLIRYATGDVVKSAIVGKVKTWALSITLILASIEHFNANLLNAAFSMIDLDLAITKPIIDVSLYITIGLGLATLTIYISEAVKNRKEHKLKLPKKMDFKRFIRRAFDEKFYLQDRGKTFIEIIDSME